MSAVIEKVYVACDECSARGKVYSVQIYCTSYDFQNFWTHLQNRLPKWSIETCFGNARTVCPSCKDNVTSLREEIVA